MNTNNGLTVWAENWPENWKNTWSPISDLRREFDRLFDDWTTSTPRGLRTDYAFVPACDVEEDENHFLLILEMAGMKKDDIKLEINDGQLMISGERHQESRQKGEGRRYSERKFGKFQRRFVLPAGIDASRVEASYEDGILRIMVPKAESSKPRQIKIGSGSTGFFGELYPPSDHRKEKVAS
ncbi:MAG: Hsp20/alpha crystallin family protein [Bdellovibrionia bacterium]